MRFGYQIQSLADPNERRTGRTDDVECRLAAHNTGQSPRPAKHRPWKLVNYFAFSSDTTANPFEAYLKTGSGRAFASKRLWQ